MGWSKLHAVGYAHLFETATPSPYLTYHTGCPMLPTQNMSEIHGQSYQDSQKTFPQLVFISKVSILSEPLYWPTLSERQANTIPECVTYTRAKDPISYSGPLASELFGPSPWFTDLVPNFTILPKSELPSGYDSGTSFTSVCLNLSIYLPWLVSQCLDNGVVFKRGILTHISEAAALHHSGQKADVVINCTGLLASKLGGVMDEDVVPARGVTILVRNEADASKSLSPLNRSCGLRRRKSPNLVF